MRQIKDIKLSSRPWQSVEAFMVGEKLRKIVVALLEKDTQLSRINNMLAEVGADFRVRDCTYVSRETFDQKMDRAYNLACAMNLPINDKCLLELIGE